MFHLLNYGQTVAIMQTCTFDSAINLLELRCLQRAHLPEKLGGRHAQQALDIERAGLKPPNFDGYFKLYTNEMAG